MREILRGFRKLDFVSDGNPIKGTQLFTSAPEKGIEGEMTFKHFVSEDIPLPTLEPGMTIEISFNRKGKPERIEAASAKQINLNK